MEIVYYQQNTDNHIAGIGNMVICFNSFITIYTLDDSHSISSSLTGKQMTALLSHAHFHEIFEKAWNRYPSKIIADIVPYTINLLIQQFYKEYNDIEFAKESEGEYILGVSLHVTFGIGESVTFSILRPYRHQHLFRLRCEHFGIDIPGKNYYDTHKEHQGFYTNKRKFISRIEALIVAQNAHQILPESLCLNRLYSEDLW